MPHIDWKHLPRNLREHMHDRLRTRDITEDDMLKLMFWISTNPEVPEGARCEDFGSQDCRSWSLAQHASHKRSAVLWDENLDWGVNL
jgi:hypothetical protein